MEKKNSYGWLVALLLVIGALAAAAMLFIRTERRMLRLVGILEQHLPRNTKKNQFTVEL